ncbi:MAG: hypothetical protein WBF60_03305, partial [Castellaniella sp.]
ELRNSPETPINVVLTILSGLYSCVMLSGCVLGVTQIYFGDRSRGVPGLLRSSCPGTPRE